MFRRVRLCNVIQNGRDCEPCRVIALALNAPLLARDGGKNVDAPLSLAAPSDNLTIPSAPLLAKQGSAYFLEIRRVGLRQLHLSSQLVGRRALNFESGIFLRANMVKAWNWSRSFQQGSVDEEGA